MTHFLLETIYINWLLLVAPFLSLVGVALMLALVALGFYFVPVFSHWPERLAFFKKTWVKRLWLVGLILMVAGPVIYTFKLDSPDLIVVKVAQPAPDATFLPVFSGHTFATQELRIDPQNGAHKVNKKSMEPGPMVLYWDGYVRTPYLSLPEGSYIVTFLAAGSQAQDAFSKIKVEFQSPDKNNYLVTRKRLYFELTPKASLYHMLFHTTEDTIGRISITFFNDVYIPETKQGRDVWLDEISVYAVRKQ